MVQIPMQRVDKKPLSRPAEIPSFDLVSESDASEKIDVDQLDRDDYEAQSGLDAMKLCIEYSPSLNSKRHLIGNQVLRRNMASFMRSATIYADAWVGEEVSRGLF